ncbi:Cna B-type domain-containing protein, partial [Eggerthia catenaformis]|uniref:Cna B-type domain-containing protein n=1 Tax=Eggerthia catenaformis TaxID=31973 RepID=UPI0028EDFDDA
MKKRWFRMLLAAIFVFSALFQSFSMLVNAQGLDDEVCGKITENNTYEKTKYYKKNPLGIIGGFHLVGFNSVETKVHTNGNILTDTLKYRSNFGTNGLDEVSYIRKLDNSSDGFKSTSKNESTLVVGTEINVGTTDHGNAWTLNGRKVDFPNRANNPKGILQDGTKKFIDIEKERQKAISINKKLSKYENMNTTGHFNDINQQHISILEPDGINVYHLDPNKNYDGYDVDATNFVKGKNGSLIINVDLKGKSSFTMPGSRIKYTNGDVAPIAEVTEWQDGNVIWNFYDSSKSDGLYTGEIKNTRAVTGIILAPAAKVDLKANFNGTVIAKDIIVSAESHRTDFTGKTLEPNKISIKINKRWVGQEKEYVIVKLLADGKDTKKTARLDKASQWKAEFKDLPRRDKNDGHEIVYSIEEVKIDGYESKITGTVETGFTITNTEKKEKTSVSGKKIWKDENNQDGIRPKEIEVVLYANGHAIQNQTVEPDNEGNWNYKFDDLDKYDSAGNLIHYTVEEDPVTGYKAIYDGFNITNEHKPETINISGSKKWIDDNDKEKKRPDEIKIGLYKGNKKIRETKATKTNNWEFKFENLPKNEKGKEIEYTIKEEPVAGYTSSIKKVSKNVYEIVNTITGKVSIPVTKTWVGPKGTKAVVKLFANGTEKQKVELNQGNNWSYIFENLDKYDGQGKKIVYTLKEESIQNYDSQITGDAETGFKVKNINTEKISIPVVKKWVGKPADSVTIKLLADGKEKIRAVLTKDSSWKDKFSNLPKYDDKDGHEIIYSISEVKVNGYNTGITGTARDGFTITNTITGKVSIPVTKLWAGKEGISATVRLYANNKEIKSTVLNKGNGWQYTFTNLKKYKNGHEIKYTIKEDPIENYKSEITGNEIKGFIVKNTNTEKVSVKGTKTWDDANNQDGKRPTQITVNLLKNGTKFKSVTVKADADGNWKYEFTNLDKYENGQEIKYTVEEEKVEGYETKVEGYNIKNSYTPEKTEVKGEKTWDDA